MVLFDISQLAPHRIRADRDRSCRRLNQWTAADRRARLRSQPAPCAALPPVSTVKPLAPELDRNQHTALSRLFSATVVRELARAGRSVAFARLAAQSGLLRQVSASARVRDFLDAAFDTLKQRDYRDEYIYKAALTQKVLLGIHSLSTATMMTEFRVDGCKADVVILNGTSTAYEIKSERDNLDRLGRQVRSYLRVFDRVTVIAGEKHLAAVDAAVPPEVGLLTLSSRFRMHSVREPVSNLARIEPAVVFESLRDNEAQEVLARCGVSVPEVPNTVRRRTMATYFRELSPPQLHAALVPVLKGSRSARGLIDVLDSVPASFKAAALATPLRAAERHRLATSMNVQLRDALAWT